MKRIFNFVVLIIVSSLGLTFVFLNADNVNINYYFDTVTVPLSFLVVISIAVGALMGVLATLGKVFSLKHELSKKDKQIRITEKELENLRSLPLKDRH